MASDYLQVHIECPFFKSYTRQTIRCEGYLKGRNIVTTFDKAIDKNQQMRMYCCDVVACKYCEVYQMVYKNRYDD